MAKATIQDEIEVKFLDINHNDIRKKLLSIQATCVTPMRTMRRATFDNDFMHTDKDSFLRIRDEGDRTTMTYKQFSERHAVDGAKEIEITISDFEKGLAIMEQTGLFPSSIQESKRETWKLDNVEIVLDEWPWLKPYIEIEGESEDALRSVARLLGLDWSRAAFGDVMVAYRAEYTHLTPKDTVGNLPEVRFGDPLPKLLKP